MNSRIDLAAALLALLFALVPSAVSAAESYDNCTGFIDSVPATITAQGTWCLRHDLSTAITSGNAITVNTNNVTIDCNDFKVGGLAAGTSTDARGVYAQDRLNVTVRHCNIRGFLMGVQFVAFGGGGNYLIENNRIDSSTAIGVFAGGDGSVVRDNLIRDTGGTTLYAPESYGIQTSGSVDVIGNTVDGLTGDLGVYGIRTVNNLSGSISGNRVRGVIQAEVGEAAGIYNISSGRIVLRDNDIVGEGTIGIYCFDSKARARGNVINGFDSGLWSCGDAGSNDITP